VSVTAKVPLPRFGEDFNVVDEERAAAGDRIGSERTEGDSEIELAVAVDIGGHQGDGSAAVDGRDVGKEADGILAGGWKVPSPFPLRMLRVTLPGP
jgi:hypothetical protein